MDAEWVKTQEFKERIAHGTLILCVGIGMTANEINPVAFSYGYDRVRFIRPVYIGDTITVTATDQDGNTFERTFDVNVQEDTSDSPPFLAEIEPVTIERNTTAQIQLVGIDVEGEEVDFAVETMLLDDPIDVCGRDLARLTLDSIAVAEALPALGHAGGIIVDHQAAPTELGGQHARVATGGAAADLDEASGRYAGRLQ